MRKLITVCAVVMFFGTNYAMAGGTTLNKPGATSTQITDIDGSNTIGQYKTADGYDHAFLYNVDGKSWITLDQIGSIGSRPEDISGNKVVGINLITTTTSDVFLYDGDKQQKWSNFDIPGRSGVNGILGSNVVGGYIDANIHHGFLHDGTNWTKFEPIGGGLDYLVSSWRFRQQSCR
jgi:hypothetical protein